MALDFSGMIFLDGASGTMYQQQGLKPGEMPEMLNIKHPEMVERVARAYVEAGSEVICTNTFGVNRHKLAGTGHRVAEVVMAAVQIARRAAGKNAQVALDVGPLGEMLEPMGSLTFEAAYDLFAEVVEAGEKAGADLILIETMTDLYETKAALLAAKEKTRLPVMVSMSFDETGRTFTGCTVSSMARTLSGLGADALGVNCSVGPDSLKNIIAEMSCCTCLPIIAKPNAGLPDPADGHYSMGPEAFAEAMTELVAAGATVIGGCCGTSPAYIRALKQAMAGHQMPARTYDAVSFVCTPTLPMPITGVRPIGERINPTGKKRLQQALLAGDLDYVTALALQQKDAGAAMLDVNVGYPGVDEKTLLPRLVKRLQAVVDLPLMLDSADADALENALRVYNGKPAVNSVNGEEGKLARILPMVKKYGAAVVGLAMDEKGLPGSCGERVTIAKRIVERAEALGIPREDVWIDCLTLTVSAQQDQARETLCAVRQVREELGLQTVLGVSNISFGLPGRGLMTQTFLTQAMAAGLTLPIVNPNQVEIMDAIAAHRVLSGEDENCQAYVVRMAGRVEPKPAAKATPVPGGAASQEIMTLRDAVIRGLRAEAGTLARAALKEQSGLRLVEEQLIPALDQVGADYETGRVFLPQLLSAAQAAQAVFVEVRAAMAREGEVPVKRGRILMATVKGDIHDIGKNIVKTVLENYGYEVIDLGRDVPPETITETAQREHIRLVGLSALMTTTLPAMEETVRALRTLPEPPCVMVGGAVVTEAFAARMGADFYAGDARDAVNIAKKVFDEK